MSSITPLKFTGVSTFSEDFQQILTRAVSIAAIPIQVMQNNQSNLITKKQSLTALNTNVQNLADAIKDLANLGSSHSLTAYSSNANKVSVQLNGANAATSYTITDITSIASKASETSVSGFATADATAVDSDNSLELVLGGATHAIDLTSYGNNLNGLRDAINALGLGVSATVLNTGSGATPYYLSLSASSPGETTLALRTTAGAAGTNILTNSNQGANASFKLNGLPVTKSDNVVSDVVPGLTFTLLDTTTSGESVTLNLSSSRATLATSLQNFVTAYNATVDKVKLQIGENAGLLSGDYIVGQIHRTLHELAGYSGSGDVKSLVDLGIELDKNGVMTFNSTKFYSLPTATIESAFSFLGSTTTGFGAYYQKFYQISDPVLGLIRTQQDIYDAGDRRLTSQISILTERIQQMQLTLSTKLQQADVLLSGLARQQSTLTESLKSVALGLYGKQS
jgi:flagellar hook-associated protein 2